MKHSLTEQLAVLITVFGAALMGWLAHGFMALDSGEGIFGCVVSVTLFACCAWEIMDD